jgi:hypothetical protein
MCLAKHLCCTNATSNFYSNIVLPAGLHLPFQRISVSDCQPHGVWLFGEGD